MRASCASLSVAPSPWAVFRSLIHRKTAGTSYSAATFVVAAGVVTATSPRTPLNKPRICLDMAGGQLWEHTAAVAGSARTS